MLNKVVELIADGEELILPLDSETCGTLDITVGDRVKWTDNGDGTWTISKVRDTELVLVETVQTFRHRYVVEVPKGKAEWALDTVTMEEAKEFSQKHLGEQISSHRVVSREEVIRIFKEDNDYLKKWTDSQIYETAVTQLKEEDDE